VAKFSGCKVKTNNVKNNLNPEWNKALKLGTGVPNKSKYLILEVWNNNWPSKDDLIGTIKIPFIDIC
jgi:Ca2+-dependent lipid-binding protein